MIIIVRNIEREIKIPDAMTMYEKLFAEASDVIFVTDADSGIILDSPPTTHRIIVE